MSEVFSINNWEWIVNLILSWALFALIWVIQLTHYPAFKYIAENQFQFFHQHHTKSISLIVIPLMLAEISLSLWLAIQHHNNWLYPVLLLLVIGVWASTFLIQVPIHNALVNGKDLKLIENLIKSNWIRTLLWTAKAILITYFSIKMIK